MLCFVYSTAETVQGRHLFINQAMTIYKKKYNSNLLGSDHSKCEDSLVAHGRWSLTRIDKQGVPSEARSQRIIFRRSLIACNSFFLFIYFLKRSGDYTTSWWNFCDILNLSQRFFAGLGKCIKRWLKTATYITTLSFLTMPTGRHEQHGKPPLPIEHTIVGWDPKQVVCAGYDQSMAFPQVVRGGHELCQTKEERSSDCFSVS